MEAIERLQERNLVAFFAEECECEESGKTERRHGHLLV
jgi:hypothetical protein